MARRLLGTVVALVVFVAAAVQAGEDRTGPALAPEAREAVAAIHGLHQPRDVSAMTGEERTLRELELATARIKRVLLHAVSRTDGEEAREAFELADAELARWQSIRDRVDTGAPATGRGRRLDRNDLETRLDQLEGAIEASLTEARRVVDALDEEGALGPSVADLDTSTPHRQAVAAFLHRHQARRPRPAVRQRSPLVISSGGESIPLGAAQATAERPALPVPADAPSTHPLAGDRHAVLSDERGDPSAAPGAGRPAGLEERVNRGRP